MSRRVSRFLAFLLFSSSIGVAAAAPRVITGIGEREAGRLFPAAPAEEPAQEPAYVAPLPTRARLAPPPPAPAYVEPWPAPQPRLVTARAEPPVAPGAYGGGFIELLVTGQTPEPQARRRVAALGAGEAMSSARSIRSSSAPRSITPAPSARARSSSILRISFSISCKGADGRCAMA